MSFVGSMRLGLASRTSFVQELTDSFRMHTRQELLKVLLH